ncbi:glycosyltransferase family 4 protein [Actinoplanes sp. NPDC000266]
MSAESPDDHPLARLRARIDELHLHNGEPSTRTISRRVGKAISHTTVNNVLRGDKLPRWDQLELVVGSLGGDVEVFRPLWIDARKAGPPQVRGAPVRKVQVPRFLLAASEWNLGLGGISTLNRELAVALADAGVDVHVAVPAATRGELSAATGAGVHLVTPDPIPGVEGKALMLAKPRFTDPGYRPDVIVGHGRQVGSYAYGLQRLYFPEARRMHIVHTDPEGLESAQQANEHLIRVLGEVHSKVEIDLAATATLVAGIGPQLTELIRDRLHGRPGTIPKVFNLQPGLHDWGQVADPRHPPALPRILLIAGSREIDMFIRAARTAAEQAHWVDRRLHLVIRGVPADAARDVRMIAGEALDVTIRPYTSAQDDLIADLRQARVVAVPAPHEKFGLEAYEAIAAGVPVLVSEESGLARMIGSLLTGEDRPPGILPTRGADADVESIWATALTGVLGDPVGAFQRAARLRGQLSARTSWKSTIAELLRQLGVGPLTPAG